MFVFAVAVEKGTPELLLFFFHASRLVKYKPPIGIVYKIHGWQVCLFICHRNPAHIGKYTIEYMMTMDYGSWLARIYCKSTGCKTPKVKVYIDPTMSPQNHEK